MEDCSNINKMRTGKKRQVALQINENDLQSDPFAIRSYCFTPEGIPYTSSGDILRLGIWHKTKTTKWFRTLEAVWCSSRTLGCYFSFFSPESSGEFILLLFFQSFHLPLTHSLFSASCDFQSNAAFKKRAFTLYGKYSDGCILRSERNSVSNVRCIKRCTSGCILSSLALHH